MIASRRQTEMNELDGVEVEGHTRAAFILRGALDAPPPPPPLIEK